MNETLFFLNKICLTFFFIKTFSDKLNIKGLLLSHHDSLCIGLRMHYYKNYNK
jgi:hypothetical protein